MLKNFFAVLLALSVLPSISSANEVYQLNSKGTFTEVGIPAGASTQQLTLYLVSTGNESQYVNFSLIGPVGIRVKARAQVLRSGSPQNLLKSTKGWTPVSFLQGSKEVSELRVATQTQSSGGSSSSSGGGQSQYYCLDYTAADLDEIIQILRGTGTTFTRDELCALYGGNSIRNNLTTGDNGIGTTNGDTTSPISSAGAYAILRKDTCGMKRNTKMLLRFDVSLSGVSAAERAAGFNLRFSGMPIRYVGSKAASVKPTSEGKFAPRALFLMHTTGFGGGLGSPERINVVRWSKGRASSRRVKIEDYLFYRGKNLARAVAEPYLRGGKATVEMQSDAAIYSVCFAMSKRRQRVNGYTN